jgi:hypothetical protein
MPERPKSHWDRIDWEDAGRRGRESRIAQGLSPTIDDPVTVALIVRLMSLDRPKRRRSREGPK